MALTNLLNSRSVSLPVRKSRDGNFATVLTTCWGEEKSFQIKLEFDSKAMQQKHSNDDQSRQRKKIKIDLTHICFRFFRRRFFISTKISIFSCLSTRTNERKRERDSSYVLQTHNTLTTATQHEKCLQNTTNDYFSFLKNLLRVSVHAAAFEYKAINFMNFQFLFADLTGRATHDCITRKSFQNGQHNAVVFGAL
jgi:hypothetical protein